MPNLHSLIILFVQSWQSGEFPRLAPLERRELVKFLCFTFVEFVKHVENGCIHPLLICFKEYSSRRLCISTNSHLSRGAGNREKKASFVSFVRSYVRSSSFFLKIFFINHFLDVNVQECKRIRSPMHPSYNCFCVSCIICLLFTSKNTKFRFFNTRIAQK